MSTTRFYIPFCFLLLLIALPLQKVFAQRRTIITTTDTVMFDIQPDEIEFKILSDFYKQAGGKKWKMNTNWLKGTTSDDMARWYGITVRNGDVVEINLDDNNLTGTISKDIYNLDGLQSVSLANNPANGDVPNQSNTSTTPQLLSMKSTMAMGALSVEETTSPTPVVPGKNLPVWGLAVQGPHVQSVDWRLAQVTGSDLLSSGASSIGYAGAAIDDCGRLAFYVLHSGIDQINQLHIYSSNGTRLTNTISGDPLRALNSVNGTMEMQVVRVPGAADEWYIIYSLYQAPCLSSPPSSGYCPAKIVYTRVKYNTTSGLVITPDKREVSISSNTFIQGKAVSRTVNGDNSRHYLYLAQREASGSFMNFTKIHRFIIDSNGIGFGVESASTIPAQYWLGTISGSSLELSPDETKLAMSNRNVGSFIKEDLIIFDLSQFNNASYLPVIVSVPNLKVAGTGKTVKELATGKYPCFGYLKNKLSLIEFSPSGRYLYCVHGGYPDGTGGVPYDTHVLQIDLQSGTGIGNYDVRMQIEKGTDTSSGCFGSTANENTNNFIEQIQSSYDGRLYFTKRYSSKLFVIPNPDDPLPNNLVPGVIDLSPGHSPNISMSNGANVLYMPENIDGYSYVSPQENNNKFTLSSSTIGLNLPVTITLVNPSGSSSYQVSWGDGTVNSFPQPFTTPVSHNYAAIGDYTVTVSVLVPSTDPTVAPCVSLISQTVKVVTCTETIGMQISQTQYLCAIKFSVPKLTDCYATYVWDFDDGTTSLDRSPMHVYNIDRTYNVTVKINYNCPSCQSEIMLTTPVTFSGRLALFEQDQVQVLTDERQQIISSAATTYSETWPLDHNEPSLENMNTFISGAQGVWRNEGTFVYNTPRSASSPVNLSTDGTYSLDYFNWAKADLEAIPKWIKANTMTRYNAYNFELENEDVLGVYSGALYDYNGQLQTAHGVNMRNGEMAYTGFESSIDKPTGNLTFNNMAVPAYNIYRVDAGNSYIAIVEATLAEIQDAEAADINAFSFTVGPLSFLKGNSRYLSDVKILCKQTYPANPNLSILVFEQAPYDQLWFGSIRIKNRVVPVVQGTLNHTMAHTGVASLMITAEKSFEQKLLQLDAGKTYYFNAWVSINNPHVATPKLSDHLGIDVILKDRFGATVSMTSMVPEGKIIEGWQQVRGAFVCPDKDLTLTLKFKPGSTGTAWYDDVRLHPEKGNMKSYVYDIADFRLRAILDEDNFASIFYYDKEGNLYLTKKETEEGIKTISENRSYQIER